MCPGAFGICVICCGVEQRWRSREVECRGRVGGRLSGVGCLINFLVSVIVAWFARGWRGASALCMLYCVVCCECCCSFVLLVGCFGMCWGLLFWCLGYFVGVPCWVLGLGRLSGVVVWLIFCCSGLAWFRRHIGARRFCGGFGGWSGWVWVDAMCGW